MFTLENDHDDDVMVETIPDSNNRGSEPVYTILRKVDGSEAKSLTTLGIIKRLGRDGSKGGRKIKFNIGDKGYLIG